jgi:hypothetical protein
MGLQFWCGPTESYRPLHNILSCILEGRGSDLNSKSQTQFIEITLSGRKNVEAVPCVRWLHYTTSTADNAEVINLMFHMFNLCDRRRYAS